MVATYNSAQNTIISYLTEPVPTMSTVDTAAETPQDPHNTTPPKLAVVLSIILAVAFIVAVIAGARIMTDRTTYTPAAVSPIDAPEAGSRACDDVIANLPDSLGAFKNVDIVDPAPEGTKAYKNAKGQQLTLRCGVYAPDQYTVLSKTNTIKDVHWLTVMDATPGSHMRTYYQLGGAPTVAITTEAPIGTALEDASSALAVHIDTSKAPKPKPFPLSSTRLEGDGHPQQCTRFLDALPKTIGDYTLRDTSAIKGAPSQSRTWLADGQEPIVVRCGVELPDSYTPGAVLSQVGEVPWFDEPGLARGSTSGRWFALGREAIVALSMPGSEGNEVISTITDTVADTLAPEKSENSTN
ncbi:DUF3515 domain-containing protein [Corynebacterium sp. 320]|nr:DUF3515 domain-containing protein [Corynebacterium sp. 320]KAB3527986.1 DUF3515 domain-containing protein [Corynebacterium sp. 250]